MLARLLRPAVVALGAAHVQASYRESAGAGVGSVAHGGRRVALWACTVSECGKRGSKAEPASRKTLEICSKQWGQYWKGCGFGFVGAGPSQAAVIEARRKRAVEEERQRVRRDAYITPALRAADLQRLLEGSRAAAGVSDWIRYKSWAYCGRCGALELLPLLVKSAIVSSPPSSAICQRCREGLPRVVPRVADYPAELRGLSERQVKALRPIELFPGRYALRATSIWLAGEDGRLQVFLETS